MRLAVVSAVLPALLLAAGAAYPETEPDAADMAVACSVSGYDVIIHNDGEETLAAGTMVEWSVRFARVERTHQLRNDMESGGRVILAGALGANYLEVGTPCEAALEGSTPGGEASD